MIEALGVPHTEVDVILVNDGPVDFGYLVQDGDTISVYPASTSQSYDDFRICPSCNRLYWAGSHQEHMQRFIERILSSH